jgi:hypothetical protein
MNRRAIAAIPLPGITPGKPETGAPEISHFDPCELLVDETYQRNLSERSINLIRRIVAGWDWRRFKPPVVAWTEDGLEVIDGQHTAIAAACHPAIETIPVMVVDAADQVSRASAFIGHNRDRLSVTIPQIHAAAVAAGDPEALAIAKVCQEASVQIVKAQSKPPRPRETIAVNAIAALLKKYQPEDAVQILKILAEAECAPITVPQIKAVELLLSDPDYSSEIDKEKLPALINSMRSTIDRDAKTFAATHSVPLYKAMASIWFKSRKKRLTPPTQSFPVPKAPEPRPALPDDIKRDKRPARGRWAPGNHIHHCKECDVRFIGERLATTCADCAYGGTA